MLDDKIMNIICKFFKNSVYVREERNRSIVSRVNFITIFILNGFLVSKETVVLRRW